MSESTALNKMLLPELKAVAASMGIRTAGLRKAELVAAIGQSRGGQPGRSGQSDHEQSGQGPDQNRGDQNRDDQGERPQRSRQRRTEQNPEAGSSEQPAASQDSEQGNGQEGRSQRRRRAERPAGQVVSIEPQPSNEDSGRSGAGSDHGDAAGDEQSSGRRNRRRDQGEEPQHSTTDEVGARLAELSQGKREDGRGQRERRGDSDRRGEQGERGNDRKAERQDRGERSGGDRDGQQDRNQNGDRSGGNDRNAGTGGNDRNAGNDRNEGRKRRQNQQNDQQQSSGNGSQAPSDDDLGGGRRGRRRRQRDRQSGRRRGQDRFEAEPTIQDDDVLVNVSGIVDISDNFATIRTSGYLPGPNDGYLSMAQVRKYNLRKGDVVTGALRQHREGERREKFSPIVRIDTVNGVEPDQMANRPEFNKLTPLYPQEKLRLETAPNNMTGRIIDLVSPIGKGQRGLIVAPPKAGKTMIMQSIANSIAANNPEVHLMVVLVDERPEEVTDFQRTVSGEVIASTFDRPASDHTQVSELAIERAKRLVELGHDVVVLLDGITRLGRAYNLAAPASGRILSGGVDSAALYPPKKFFGAARNIEHGGSLTILATALVETGSRMDEVIFEEFKGTGNMELRLSRSLSDKRVFPAIDVNASGTRREELLLGREELSIMWKLRRVMSGLDDTAGSEMLLSRLRKTQNNNEFLVMISKTTPSND